MDELDELIESSLGFDSESSESPEDDQAPPESDATEEGAAEEVEEEISEDSASEGDDSQEEDLPDDDDDPDGTDDSPEQPVQGDPELTRLQQQVQQQQRFIASVIEQARTEQQKQEAQQKKDEEDREYQKLTEKWDEMDPDDARREQTAYLAQRAAERDKALRAEIENLKNQNVQLHQQQEQERLQREEASARLEVIDLLTKRHKLTDFEVRTMSRFQSAYEMDEYAKDAQAQRKSQTKAARSAKKQELESNPALKAGEPGGGAPPVTHDFKDVDELLDSMFGKDPI